MQKHFKRLAVFLGVLFIGLALMGCGKSTEVMKPVDRWKSLGETNDCNWFLDTHSIIKIQTEKAAASTTDTIKRDLYSVWVKIEKVPGKEEIFAKNFGKDASYGMFYLRIDKLNKEVATTKHVILNSEGNSIAEKTEPIIQLSPYLPGSIADKIAKEL